MRCWCVCVACNHTVRWVGLGWVVGGCIGFAHRLRGPPLSLSLSLSLSLPLRVADPNWGRPTLGDIVKLAPGVTKSQNHLTGDETGEIIQDDEVTYTAHIQIHHEPCTTAPSAWPRCLAMYLAALISLHPLRPLRPRCLAMYLAALLSLHPLSTSIPPLDEYVCQQVDTGTTIGAKKLAK